MKSFGKYLDNATPDKLKNILESAQADIWKSGLAEDAIHECVKIFLETDHLSYDIRALMLQCLVPNVKVPEATINALIAWFFSKFKRDLADAKSFLHWLSVMLSNNLIETTAIEALINQFMFCFYYSELISPICSVLRHVINSQSITPRTVFIAKFFFECPINYEEKGKLSFILRMMNSCLPSLIPNPPCGTNVFVEKFDNFSKAVSHVALVNGFVKTSASDKKVSTSVQQVATKKSVKVYSVYALTDVANLSQIKDMRHLGWMIKKNKISHLQRLCSLLGSKAGQIYLSARTITHSDFPCEDKYTTIPMLGKLLESSQRIRNGLPIVTKILDGFLLSWDGDENREIIYTLLPWIHFNTFEELYTTVLCHLMTLFFTGTIKDKVCILDCLTEMITNKVTKMPRTTCHQLITLSNISIKLALAADCFQSSAFLLSCLRFYQCILYLEQRYMLGSWTVPPPYLVFGAFFSRNYVLISEICELVVRHNVEMYPFFISLRIIHDYQDQVEVIKAYLRDLYLLLWKGQASKTELVGSGENDTFSFFNQDMEHLFSARMHYGIIPLTSYFADKLKLTNHKSFNIQSLIRLLDRRARGISAVKRAYER